MADYSIKLPRHAILIMELGGVERVREIGPTRAIVGLRSNEITDVGSARGPMRLTPLQNLTSCPYLHRCSPKITTCNPSRR